jgi:putative Mg2+ transporter-C (MgtC) family protein
MSVLADLDWKFALDGLVVIVVAGMLTGLVGLEREFARKPAGLRTHMLVGVAAAAFMLLGRNAVVAYAEQQSPNLIEADPVRVIQSIVLGISVLGAGTIVHSGGGEVEGLTTAASVLLAAAIGIAVANDQVLFGAGLAVLAALILFVIGLLERWRDGSAPRSHENDS